MLVGAFISPLLAQIITPNLRAYYTFDGALPADSWPNGLHIDQSTPSLISGNFQPLKGNYIWYNQQDMYTSHPVPEVSLATMSQDTVNCGAVTLEFWIRPGNDFDFGYPIFWENRLDFFLSDQRLEARVHCVNNVTHSLKVPLNQIGRKDPTYYTDGNWHQIALVVDGQTGKVFIYVDGVCPAGFSKQFPGMGALNDGDNFYFNFNKPDQAVRYEGALDEVALFDEALPAKAIYQHFLDVSGGNIYQTTLNLTNIVVPQNYLVDEYTTNPFEFAPGYPNVGQTGLELFKTYPGTRFGRHHGLPRNNPWAPRLNILSDGSWQGGKALQREMIDHFHYKLLLGSASQAKSYDAVNINNTAVKHFTDLAEEGKYDSIPRLLITSWANEISNMFPSSGSAWPNSMGYLTKARFEKPGLDTAAHAINFLTQKGICSHVKDTSLFFWSPAAPLWIINDSIRDYDGWVLKTNLVHIISKLTRKGIEEISENGEMLRICPEKDYLPDPRVGMDFSAFGGSWEEYKASRGTRFRQKYLHWSLAYLDSLNSQWGLDSTTTVQWYSIGGNQKYSHGKLQYDTARTILTETNGIRRASPYLYPQRPQNWRYAAGGPLTGISEIVAGRIVEIGLNEPLFNPFVSPGFNDSTDAYDVGDHATIRPGQWLGLLKNLGVMGADMYTPFLYSPADSGEYRVWKLAIPGYAQGITSRFPQFMYQGTLLEGDTGVAQLGANLMFTAYSFSTGSLMDYVNVRQLNGSDVFMISGSAQKSGWTQGNGDHERNVMITLANDPVHFQVRRQGSTYIFDKSVNPPLFIQLDRWHEWKEPYWWCRDFLFDAEVADTASGFNLHTETANAVSQYDFRNFTSFIAYSNGGFSEYAFLVRDSLDQDTLYPWIRARISSGSAQIDLNMDGNQIRTVSGVNSPNWEWYRPDSGFWVLQKGYHLLRLENPTAGLEIDQILLKRWEGDIRPDTLTQAFFTWTAGCAGTPTQFTNLSTTIPGCVDYRWTFGDGGKWYTGDSTVSHVFPAPGNYPVTLILTEQCTGHRDTFVDTVTVPGLLLSLGPDLTICQGDSVEIEPDTIGAGYLLNWTWTKNLINYDTTVTSFWVWPDTSVIQTQYNLHALDTLTGCEAEDSFLLSVIQNPKVTLTLLDSVVCDGEPLQLLATGGFCYMWSPDSVILDSNKMIPNPKVEITDSTLMIVTGWDVNMCASSSDSLWLVPMGKDSMVPPPIKVCEGALLQLGVSGGDSFSWTATLGGSGSSQALPGILDSNFIATPTATMPAFPLWFKVKIYRNGCEFNDQYQVLSESVDHLSNGPDSTVCAGDTILLHFSGTFANPNAPDGIGYSTNKYDSIFWFPSGIQADNKGYAFVVPQAPATYTAVLWNNGCSRVDTVRLSPALVAHTSFKDTSICQGDTVELQSHGGDSLLGWLPTDSLLDPFSDTTMAWPTQTTTFQVARIDSNGCFGVDTVRVELFQTNFTLATHDTSVCGGDSVLLLASGGISYQWSPANSLSGASNDSAWAFPDTTTTYTVVITDSNGCVGTDTVRVVVNENGFGTTFEDTTVCAGSGLVLSTTGGVSFSWSPAAGLPNPFSASTLAYIGVSTTYTVEITDSNGCKTLDSTVVNANINPFGAVFEDSSICVGDSLQLLTTGGSLFVWTPFDSLDNPNYANPWAWPTVTTDYVVGIFDSNGCTAIDTVHIVVIHPIDSIITNDTSFCYPDTLQILVIGFSNFQWTPAAGLSNPQAHNPLAWPHASTLYQVEYLNSDGCTIHDSIYIAVGGIDSIQNHNDTICNGNSLPLVTSGGATFQWTPSAGLSNPSVGNPVASPSQTTDYHVLIADTLGCTSEDSVQIAVKYATGGADFPDTALCENATALLTASGGVSYQWSPGNTATYATVGEYYVTIWDSNGCSLLDTVVVTANPNCCIDPRADTLLTVDSISNLIPWNSNLSTFTSKTFEVVDTLYIDANVTFQGCDFKMDSMAVIWIYPGYTMTVYDCDFDTSVCANWMWAGIFLEDSTAGLVFTDSRVANSEQGVYARNGGYFAGNSGMFWNNYRHIQVENQIGTWAGHIHSMIFDSDSTQMLPPWQGWYTNMGVRARNVGFLAVGDVSGTSRNLFRNCVRGVYAQESGIKVVKNDFRNMKPQKPILPGQIQLPDEGIGVYVEGKFKQKSAVTAIIGGTLADKNTFRGGLSGVRTYYRVKTTVSYNNFDQLDRWAINWASNQQTQLEANKNIIDSVFYGIIASANIGSNVTINGNKIGGELTSQEKYTVSRGIEVSDINWGIIGSPGYYHITGNYVWFRIRGIDASACQNLEIKNNQLWLDVLTAAGFNKRGINVVASGGYRVENNIVKAIPGNAYSVKHMGIWIEQSPNGYLTCNEVRDFYHDVTFYGNKSFGQTVRRNYFYNGERGFVLWDQADIGAQGAGGNPTSDIWQGGYTHSKMYCDNTNGGGISWYVVNSGTQNFSLFGGTKSGNGGTPITPFTTSGASNWNCLTGGIVIKPGGGTTGTHFLKVADGTQVYTVDSLAGRFLDRQLLYETLLLDTSLLLSDSAFMEFMNEESMGNLPMIKNGVEYAAQGDSTNLALSSLFFPDNLLEENHQKVISMVSEMEDEDYRNLPAQETSEMEGISENCIYSFGLGSCQARTLVKTWDPIKEYSECIDSLTGNSKNRAISQIGQAEQIEIWPNPSEGRVTVGVPQVGQVLEIIDSFGRVLIRQFMEKEIHEFELSGFPAGFYKVRYLNYPPGSIIIQR